MSGKKRAHETIDVDAEPKSEPGDDWKRRTKQLDIHRDDWARAGFAADTIVERAMNFVVRPPSDDVLFAQHVKAQLAYLNMCKTSSVAASVDGALLNTVDGTLTCLTQFAKPVAAPVVKEEKDD